MIITVARDHQAVSLSVNVKKLYSLCEKYFVNENIFHP